MSDLELDQFEVQVKAVVAGLETALENERRITSMQAEELHKLRRQLAERESPNGASVTAGPKTEVIRT